MNIAPRRVTPNVIACGLTQRSCINRVENTALGTLSFGAPIFLAYIAEKPSNNCDRKLIWKKLRKIGTLNKLSTARPPLPRNGRA